MILDNVGQELKFASSHQVLSFLMLPQIENELLKKGIQEQMFGYVLFLTFLEHG